MLLSLTGSIFVLLAMCGLMKCKDGPLLALFLLGKCKLTITGILASPQRVDLSA